MSDDPLTVRVLYSPHDPHPPQHAFLLLDELEVLEALFGGAGGGGKSDAMLMAALRYVDVPGYSALLLRKTFADLNLPGAIMARAKEWLAGTDARWVERDFRFTFPSGASVSFGYLQTSNDRYRYAGAEFQFVGFDELTQFAEDDYRFLFTRLRKPAEGPLAHVPLRMRGATNPGGRGHAWVLRRLVERKPAERRDDEPPDPTDTPERAAARVFIPAKLRDNPSVDASSYEESLANADPHTRAQILEGDWYARPPGDWIYDHRHLEAVFALGDELDAELERGTIAPPAGDLLAVGIDWGEHAHALIGWPLENGGLYVVAEVTGESDEPGELAARIIGRHRDRDEPDVDGMLEVIYALASRPRTGAAGGEPAGRGAGRMRDDLPPPLPPGRDPVHLVEDHRFDAAGIQSMRTYAKIVRRRQARARTTAVPFGAPAPRSGTSAGGRSYKAETIGYLRGLARRAGEGKRTRVLAVGRRAPELRRQLRELEWKDREAGIVEKGDDHGPDALIALTAPRAIRGR